MRSVQFYVQTDIKARKSSNDRHPYDHVWSESIVDVNRAFTKQVHSVPGCRVRLVLNQDNVREAIEQARDEGHILFSLPTADLLHARLYQQDYHGVFDPKRKSLKLFAYHSEAILRGPPNLQPFLPMVDDVVNTFAAITGTTSVRHAAFSHFRGSNVHQLRPRLEQGTIMKFLQQQTVQQPRAASPVDNSERAAKAQQTGTTAKVSEKAMHSIFDEKVLRNIAWPSLPRGRISEYRNLQKALEVMRLKYVTGLAADVKVVEDRKRKVCCLEGPSPKFDD